MLEVTLKMIPDGNRKEERVIGILEIVNDLTSDEEHMGNYRYKLYNISKPSIEGRIEEFPRIRGAWELVRDVLEEVNWKRFA